MLMAGKMQWSTRLAMMVLNLALKDAMLNCCKDVMPRVEQSGSHLGALLFPSDALDFRVS